MATNNITLVWDDTNEIEKGHRIYRSTTPMDIANMPTPIATLDIDATSFVDENLTVGDVFYYRVSAFIDGDEQFSSEIMAEVSQLYNVYTVSDDDRTIKYSSEGASLWISTQHTNNVNDVAIDANNNVFTVSDDNLVIMVDSANIKQWEFTGHSTFVNSVSVNNDGFIYTADDSGVLKKIDYTGNEVWSRNAHSTSIIQVYADYGDVVYTISNDSIKRWLGNGHLDSTKSLSTSPTSIATNIYTSDIIVSSGNEIMVIKYDFNYPLPILTFTGHTNTVNDIAYDKNDHIISGSNDMTVKKIDMNGNVIYSYTNDANVLSVAVNDSGNVFFADSNFNLKMLNNSGEVMWVDNTHTETINRVNITRLIELLPVLDVEADWEELVAPTGIGLSRSQIEMMMQSPTPTGTAVTDTLVLSNSKPTQIEGVYDETL